MKIIPLIHLIPLIPATLLTVTAIQAAPSTDLGAEIQIPLESQNAFALVHKTTGDVRLVIPGVKGDYTSTTYSSGLTEITGVTSGLNDGTDEFLILASPTQNRLSRFNLTSGNTTPLFPPSIAPKFPAMVRKANGTPDHVILSHTMNAGKNSLAIYGNPTGGFSHIDTTSTVREVTSFQPFFENPAGSRYAAGVHQQGAISEIFVYGNKFPFDVKVIDKVPNGLKLATNILREDNRHMIVGFVPETKKVYFFLMGSPPTIDNIEADIALPNIGSIAPASTDGSTTGILVTSADGNKAYHYEITTANKLQVIQGFTTDNGDPIHGLVPVPGQGIMLLSGNDLTEIDRFERMIWDGNQWAVKQSEFLSGLGGAGAPAQDFATLFWFDAEPMVTPDAQLLKLEVTPDWTSKSSSAAIPSKLFAESFLNSQDGLDNPIPFALSPPAGAQFVMANQLMSSVSLSALDSTLALTLPPINVSPKSGIYTSPLQITASSAAGDYRVYYRNIDSGTGWKQFTSPIAVAYTSTWQFYASKPTSGVNGPILTREFTFNRNDITSFDSDGDSIPDFVERANGLNPNGGVDTDADGFSDLDELLNGSNPNSAASTPASGNFPFNGQGFRILAQTKNHNNAVASNGDPTQSAIQTDGVPVDLRGMTSNLLASSPTEMLTAPDPFPGNLAASLQVKNPLPNREWLVLSTPQYFDINGAAPETRSGREIYKVLQRPVQNPPAITPILTGNDIDADAAAWVAASTTAYGTYSQVAALTPVTPSDTPVAVLAEATLYNALHNLNPADQTTLGVPQDASPLFGYNRFTLFGDRSNDTSRTSLSTAMLDALIYDGLSLPNLLTGLESAVTTSPELLALTQQLYDFHVAHSAPSATPANVIPLLPLPLDVLRGLARGGDLPTDYTPATTPARVTAAQAEMTVALATLDAAYRPVETWTVEVLGGIIAGETYRYRKSSNSRPAAFFEPDGDRYTLNQGMGLAIGTRFTVTGYIDISGPAGHDSMELISLNVLFVPLASDNDSDANLLADDWEKFFFGTTGAVDPFAKHPVNGYTYLQLYLIGADPRDDAAPSEDIAILFPGNTTTVQLPSGNFALQFKFPDAYVGHFEFIVQESGVLNGFGDLPEASTVTSLGGNTHQIDVGPTASSGTQNFFRLYLRLKND